MGEDPLPYGLARKCQAMEAVIWFARDQQILSRPLSPTSNGFGFA